MRKLFFDASALFAAMISPTGGARALIQLAIVDDVALLISQHVVQEVARNLDHKAPALVTPFAALVGQGLFQVVDTPAAGDVRAAEHYVARPDALVVAAAVQARAEFLITVDRRQLLAAPAVAARSGPAITTAGDALDILRGRDVPPWAIRERGPVYDVPTTAAGYAYAALTPSPLPIG